MSVRINLLDWRGERRRLRKRRFLALLGASAAGSALVLALSWLTVNTAVDRQQARNQYLSQQIAELDKQIREIQELEKVKQSLLSRMRVIGQLQQSRSATVHFFDELVNTLPDGVYLTSIKQSGDSVTLDGVAESNARISAYLNNLDSSAWFKEPKLVVIKSSDKLKQRGSEFTLQVTNLTKTVSDTATTTVAAGGKP